jgi:23S rRNA pseudouridine1911/1915/1917 synthase
VRRLREKKRKIVMGFEPRTIFEDDSLLVIDKPAGMVVNKAQTVTEETVQEWFGKKYGITVTSDSEFGQKGGVVHRLDKETSGLMLLAKNPEAYENLKQQFLERKTTKEYRALVHGTINPEKGIISLPVVRHPKAWGKFTTGTDLARTAITEWESLREFTIKNLQFKNQEEKVSLLRLMPMTGRTHQLRVHLKHLNHPIVGDPLYLNDRWLAADREWCPRMFLHAYQLTFFHPLTGETVKVTAELPPPLQQVLEKLVH